LPDNDIETGTDITPSAFLVAAIAADHMRRTIDDNLRRVDIAIAAHLGIGFLPCTEARVRQRVFPAEIIPIIDRQTERDNVRILGQLAENPVGFRT
jgi:hypothetical protein